jgi:hypothetical protein
MGAYQSIDQPLEPLYYEIELTEPQSDFYLGREKYKLFVGGFGSGKSFTLALNVVSDLENYQGADIGVYAPTFDLLALIAMPYIAELLENGGYDYKIDIQKHIFKVKGYGRIICRSMDNPSKIVGYQVFRSHIDELDTMPESKARNAWNKIIARNRQKIYEYDENGNKIPLLDKEGNQLKKQNVLQYIEAQNGVCAYTTPEGFRFAYKCWMKEQKDNPDYAIYKVSTRSNPHLQDDYIANLEASYPPELVQAYVDGEFTNLTSGRVYKRFDRKSNRSNEVVEDDEPIFVGMDFNIEHGAAVIHVRRYNGDHAVDEIVNSYDTDDTIRILKERYPKNKIYVYPDATGAKRSSGGSNGVDTKGQATNTDLAKLRLAGFTIIVDGSNPRIKDRVAAVQARICSGNGVRKYFVNAVTCPNLIETLEQQIYSNGVPDKAAGLDHVGDCIGYYIAKTHPIEKPIHGYLKYRRG